MSFRRPEQQGEKEQKILPPKKAEKKRQLTRAHRFGQGRASHGSAARAWRVLSEG